jgi:3',5'-cyclic AMP phosphodiesterase CpdA
MKPFDLEAAKACKPIQFRDGRKVKFVSWVPEAVPNERIVIVTQEGHVHIYPENGRYRHHNDKDYFIDLVMAPEKKTVWINLYSANANYWYESEEIANRCVAENRLGGKAFPLEVEI